MKVLLNCLPEERRVEALTEKDVCGRAAVYKAAQYGSAEVIIQNLITHIIMITRIRKLN